MRRFILILFLFLSIVLYSEEKIMRFIVMGDPQFGLKIAGDFNSGFVWSSPLWEKMPEICKKLNVNYFFVCGDIFALETGGVEKNGRDVCNENAPKIFWDEWERYLKNFEGICKVGWIVGGHEFAYCRDRGETYWNNNSRNYFLKNYSDKIRYTIIDGEHLFILFDKTHDWDYLSQEGFKSNESLTYLENVLEKYKNMKYKWFFGHTPPRNITQWWPDKEIKENKDMKLAKLLEKNNITAAFFGHEHDEYFIGNRGGFFMFETGMHYPLLVEVTENEIKYKYLVDPLNSTKIIDPFKLPTINDWKISIIKKDKELSFDLNNMNLEENKEVEFKTIKVNEKGEVDLGKVEGLEKGDKIIAIGEFKSFYYKGCHIMIKSQIPFSIWINGNLLEKNSKGDDRYHFYSTYSVNAKEEKNKVVVLLEFDGKGEKFVVYRDLSIRVLNKFFQN